MTAQRWLRMLFTPITPILERTEGRRERRRERTRWLTILDAPGLTSPTMDATIDITDRYAFQKSGNPNESILVLNVTRLFAGIR
jgi:hypothetical protein